MEKETKKCPQCGRELPLSAFGKNRSKKEGLASWCKECNREYRKIARREKRYGFLNLITSIDLQNRLKEAEKRFVEAESAMINAHEIIEKVTESVHRDSLRVNEDLGKMEIAFIHREIAKQLNTLADFMRNMERKEFVDALSRLFYLGEDGVIYATPINYDLFT